MSEPTIAQVGKPIQITWRNRRVKTRENDNGVFFLTEFEFDEDAWGFLKTIPRNANGEMVIWVTEEGFIPEKKTKKEPKGPHGQLWRELRLAGFLNCPGIRESIEEVRSSESEDAWALLHRVFDGCESLAVIGPDEIWAKFPPNEWPAIKTMVEQAQRRAGGEK